MKTLEKISKTGFKKLGILGIGLCVLCCTLPIVGVVLGVGALSGLAIYLEKAGIVALIVSAGFLAIAYLRKAKPANACGTSCETDCACETDGSLTKNNT